MKVPGKMIRLMGMEFMFPGMGMQMGPSVAAIMPAPGSMPGMGGF